ncbi:MAG TPA: hypothetical protein V6D07_02170 [Trichocoleus sp.]
MEPLVINEKMVSTFKFWADGQVQDGMNCRNEIFGCLKSTNLQGRNYIYELAWSLAQKGIEVVITVSEYKYTLWSNLRSLDHSEALLELAAA